MLISRRTITRLAAVLLLALLPLLLNGCGEAPQTDDDSVALIKRYLQAQEAGDIVAAAAMFPPESRLQWQAFLQQSVKDRGHIKQYVIESIEPNTVYSGKYYLATVRVTGAKANSLEMVTAFRKVTEDQTTIVSHKIKIRR